MKSFKFNGNGFEYFRIWIVNILLTIITLGIYYPWARVRNNRYLYTNTSLEENNFEYHASGKQLYIVYIVVAVLFIIYNVLEHFNTIIGLSFIFILCIAIPWIIWTNIRFKLNVTSFNNIHFKFIGGLKESYVTFFIYPTLFLLLTLAIILIAQKSENSITIVLLVFCIILLYIYALGVFITKKNRYIINSLKYGKGEFQVNLKVKKFVLIIFKSFLISLLAYVLSFVIVCVIFILTINDIGIINKVASAELNSEFMTSMVILLLPLILISYLLIITSSLLGIAYFTIQARAYVYKNTTLDDTIYFKSTMKFIPYSIIITSNFLLIFLTLGLAIPWAKVRVARYTLENTKLSLNREISVYINQIQEKE